MNNKTNIVLGLFAVTALTLGFANFANAATYQYINTSGQLSTLTANSSQEALATASKLSLHSGVILLDYNTPSLSNNDADTSGQDVQGQGLYVYQYVNTSGNLLSVAADSPQAAMLKANNIAPHSGVMLQ